MMDIDDQPEKATIWGPRTGPLPVVGTMAGELPYARGRRPHRWLAVAVALVVVVGVAAIVAVRVQSGSSEPTGTAAAPSAPAPSPTPAPTAPPVSAAPPPTAVTTVPVDPSGPPPTPHRAVYRDGKLILEGAVPDGATGQKLYDKAAAVVGKENVIGGYVIDSRVPPQTDGRVTVDQRFVFPSGSAVLDPTYSNVLQLGLIVMTQNPQVTMVINGYSDSTGDPNQNLLLSQARASSVVSYYVSKGIDVNRFVPIGHGSAEPVAPNETEAGRAQNRRIEVTLLHLIG